MHRFLLILRVVLAVIFLVLGVIGLVIPVMPQIIFFAIAAILLFPRSRFAEWTLRKAEPRAPRLARWCRNIGIGAPPQRDTIRPE